MKTPVLSPSDAPTSEAVALIECRALRHELLMRMFLQNSLLILQPILLLGAFALGSLRPSTSNQASLVFLCCSLSGAAMWCHHGVRTGNLKQFLMQSEARLGGHQTWEQFLPGARPATLLGSRWLISTKGTFLLLQGLGLWFPYWINGHLDLSYAGVGALTLLCSQGLLFSNPKE